MKGSRDTKDFEPGSHGLRKCQPRFGRGHPTKLNLGGHNPEFPCEVVRHVVQSTEAGILIV